MKVSDGIVSVLFQNGPGNHDVEGVGLNGEDPPIEELMVQYAE